MPEGILRLSPDQVNQMLKQGKMEIVTAPQVEPVVVPGGKIEVAKRLFGEDFLGEEAIRVMESKCNAARIDVKFGIPTIPFPYSEDKLRLAKEDEQKGKARMVVLRPDYMEIDGERKPITVLNLRELFKSKNPFGGGKIFYSQDWYNSEPFAQAPLKPSYALPTKEVIPGSLSKTWNDQEALLEHGETRREAIETVWDEIFYYAATGKKILERHWDWGKTRTSGGRLVYAGPFNSLGLYLHRYLPEHSRPFLGVVASQ